MAYRVCIHLGFRKGEVNTLWKMFTLKTEKSQHLIVKVQTSIELKNYRKLLLMKTHVSIWVKYLLKFETKGKNQTIKRFFATLTVFLHQPQFGPACIHSPHDFAFAFMQSLPPREERKSVTSGIKRCFTRTAFHFGSLWFCKLSSNYRLLTRDMTDLLPLAFV